MGEKNWAEIGKNVGENIDAFLQSDTVKELRENIADSLRQGLSGVKTTVDSASVDWKRKYKDVYEYQEVGENKRVVKRYLPAVKDPKGSGAGVALISGGVAAGGFLGAVGVFSLLGASSLVGVVTGAVLSVGAIAIGSGAILNGKGKIDRANRYKRYLTLFHGKEFADIKLLADKSGTKEKVVRKDLNFMTKEGWFYEGHMDRNQTCFMLTDSAYEQYQAAENSREEREKEEYASGWTEANRELLRQLEEKFILLEQIKEYKNTIQDADVKASIETTGQIGDRIFEEVRKDPDDLDDIKKFINYYLPTTLKAVQSYGMYEKETIESDIVIKSKQEIKDTLQLVCNAFQNLLEKIQQDDAMDLSSDMEVMSALMAQEGLLDSKLKQ
ncbi:MAG: 5-bromo-4-chloroindolyl phosphate hydrolysis family protein [Lachnospiraceae bacterium]|nr:5-bromo-4-chloroindolyl phosphate hydrolysis family protein [Lachnospiraceae bacterium]